MNNKTMKQENKTRSYARFYALLSKLPGDDKNELKEELIYTISNNRTTSLKELTDNEYTALLEWMGDVVGRSNKRPPVSEEERQLRSVILKLLDKLGVHVVNDSWDIVNTFLLQPRIAGKLLYEMNVDELKTLQNKLNSIIDKNRNAKVSISMGQFSMN